MKRLAFASFATLVASSCVCWVACSNSGSTASPKTDAGVTTDAGPADAGPAAPTALGVPCTDVVSDIYADAGDVSSFAKGAIIKCATEPDISASALQALAAAAVSTDDPPAQNIGYTGTPFTSGAHVYRILYRTERGDPAASPGYASAQVLIPDTPRASGTLPLLIGGHATWGEAPTCVAAKGVTTSYWIPYNVEAQVYPMVGSGLPMIMPDLAGYANFGAPGNPPSGYADSVDEAKSTLDAARALATMFPKLSSGKVVLLGHSQGAHSALSSLALQAQYAPDVNVVAVAVYSPLWLAERQWGALLFEASDYPIATSPSLTAWSIYYHYSHAELLDGPGQGVNLFQASQQAAIQTFFDTECDAQGWTEDGGGVEYPGLQAIATTALDLYDPSFVSSVAKPAALGTPCAGGDTVCTTWMARYEADRPPLPSNVPILIEWGEDDDEIAPGRVECVVQNLQSQSVPYSFCMNPGVGHEGVVRASANYVTDWIVSKTMGGAAPAPCTLTDQNLVADEAGVFAPLDDGGAPIPCSTPPPNN
ncbi:MAG: alpha/beta fold hydrolase [Polyangiaceae bacterium]